MDDTHIVGLYWARSENAIAETQCKYGAMLKGVSFALVQSAEDAEECVNDTYLVAWNSMPTERPKYLGAFLAKIVRRISVDRYRASHAEKRCGATVPIDELAECLPSSVTTEGDYKAVELSRKINDFLLELPKKKRFVFVRRYFYSDSVTTIAQSCKMSEANVKTVLCRVRRALKEYLEKEALYCEQK